MQTLLDQIENVHDHIQNDSSDSSSDYSSASSSDCESSSSNDSDAEAEQFWND